MKNTLHIALTAVMGLIAVMIMTVIIGTCEAHAIDVYPAYEDGKIEFIDYNSEDYVNFNYVVHDAENMDIKSSDEAVLTTYYGDDFDQMGSHFSSSSWYGIPVSPGTCTVTVTNKNDTSDTWTATVTVGTEYFQSVLDNLSYDYGPVAPYPDAEYYSTSTVGYGDKKLIVRAPYGSIAYLYVDDQFIAAEVAGESSRIDFSADFMKKLKTPVKVAINWAGASKSYTIKIASRSKVFAIRIKKNSRTAKYTVRKVHKGDYLKIKVGKKVVKTVKFKSNISEKTLKWTNKKKMKKGTKVTYTLYNKFKQKLAGATRKVG